MINSKFQVTVLQNSMPGYSEAELGSKQKEEATLIQISNKSEVQKPCSSSLEKANPTVDHIQQDALHKLEIPSWF